MNKKQFSLYSLFSLCIFFGNIDAMHDLQKFSNTILDNKNDNDKSSEVTLFDVPVGSVWQAPESVPGLEGNNAYTYYYICTDQILGKGGNSIEFILQEYRLSCQNGTTYQFHGDKTELIQHAKKLGYAYYPKQEITDKFERIDDRDTTAVTVQPSHHFFVQSRLAPYFPIVKDKRKKKLDGTEGVYLEAWEILGVPKNTPIDQIKKVSKTMLIQCHPDKNTHDIENAKYAFQLLKQALDELQAK